MGYPPQGSGGGGGGGAVLAPSYGDNTIYPWASTAALNDDPAYSYTTEVSQSSTSYTTVAYYDFNEELSDIATIFVNLIWAMKITGSGTGKVKWQIASGTNASPGTYVDITDEPTETLSSYVDHARSGAVTKITSLPTQTPFTIRCLVANVSATSAEAKVKSNSYIRIAYQRVT